MTRRAAVRAIGVATGVLLMSLATNAIASGTYSGRPPRPPSSVDRATYELGKHVFAGEIETSHEAGPAQVGQLEELKEKLPARARAREGFTELAGRLSDEQVEALRYYLQKRYKVR